MEELGSKAKAAHSFASVIFPRFRFVDAIRSSVATPSPWVLAFGNLVPPFATVFASSYTKDDTSVVPAFGFVGRAALAVVEAADLAFGEGAALPPRISLSKTEGCVAGATAELEGAEISARRFEAASSAAVTRA